MPLFRKNKKKRYIYKPKIAKLIFRLPFASNEIRDKRKKVYDIRHEAGIRQNYTDEYYIRGHWPALPALPAVVSRAVISRKTQRILRTHT